jgi:hypothetical protein
MASFIHPCLILIEGFVMSPMNRAAAYMLVPLVAFAIFGCGDSASDEAAQPLATTERSPEHHAADEVHITADDVVRPPDYAAGVERIIDYRDTIRDEIAGGRPSKAHRPLDEATFVLEWMPELARDSGVAKEHWEPVNLSAQEIRTLLDQIHEQIDNGEQPDFDSIAVGIQQAIDTLSAVRGQGYDL